MLLGENWCWSLLGPKGLRWSTLYSLGCASKGPYGPNLAPISCSHLGLDNGQCLAKMTICPEKRSVCRSFWEDTFKNKWAAKKIYFYSIHSTSEVSIMRTSMTIVFHLTFACNDNNFNIHLTIIDQSEERHGWAKISLASQIRPATTQTFLSPDVYLKLAHVRQNPKLIHRGFAQ